MILQAMVESGEIALDDHEWVSGADVNLLARPAWNETVVDLAPVTHDREGTPRFGVARIGERRPLWRRIADGVAWACLAVAAVEGAWLVYFIAHEMISCGEAGRR
jgi:hypothetical protein